MKQAGESAQDVFHFLPAPGEWYSFDRTSRQASPRTLARQNRQTKSDLVGENVNTLSFVP